MLTKGRNVSAVICHRKACKSTLTVAWSCARERGQTWRRRPRAGLWRNRAVGLRKDEHKAQWMYCQCPSGIQSEEIEENSLGIQCSWRFSVFLALACECDITVPVVPCGTVVWASWPVLPHVCTGSSVRVRCTSVSDGSPWSQSRCFLRPAQYGSPAFPLNASSRQSRLCSAVQSLFETLFLPCVRAINGGCCQPSVHYFKMIFSSSELAPSRLRSKMIIFKA